MPNATPAILHREGKIVPRTELCPAVLIGTVSAGILREVPSTNYRSAHTPMDDPFDLRPQDYVAELIEPKHGVRVFVIIDPDACCQAGDTVALPTTGEGVAVEQLPEGWEQQQRYVAVLGRIRRVIEMRDL